jgi:hypothetical protein
MREHYLPYQNCPKASDLLFHLRLNEVRAILFKNNHFLIQKGVFMSAIKILLIVIFSSILIYSEVETYQTLYPSQTSVNSKDFDGSNSLTTFS